MQERQQWSATMADCTLCNGSRVALKGNGLHVVVGLPAWRNDVRTAVTRRAVHSAVASGISIKGIRLLILREEPVMTVAAPRLVDPGSTPWVANRFHRSVAVETGHAFQRVDIPQALRISPRMTRVARYSARHEIEDIVHARSVSRMH
jgi:hypothetical protein